jgi:2-oxoglutarate dehydrogenase E2 component (dihydrolipoamide succinyltransferase)
MTIEIKVPQLPESVTDATLVSWHKKAGETVARDENLVDLETDKVVLEVPAPAAGTLSEIKISDGTTVTSGDLLALLEEGDAGAKATPVEATKAESTAAPLETASDQETSYKLSPAVRRLLDEHDLDASIVIGSAGTARTEQRVPMTRLRARIAERMVEAQHSAAMLTTFNEVDLTKVMSLRKRYKESFEKEHGVRLGFMSFFAKAAVEALKKYPVVNASVEGTDIIYHDYFDIGIAVSSERGLLVPVLRNVDQLSFAQIESDIAELGKKAREGTMSMEDLTGGTFTITNGGVFGSMLSTPILNPPQSAILGMHAIQERPMVVDGEVAVRPMMYLALTYDHRIIDGKEAVQFLVSLKNLLEDPGRLLLQV